MAIPTPTEGTRPAPARLVPERDSERKGMVEYVWARRVRVEPRWHRAGVALG